MATADQSTEVEVLTRISHILGSTLDLRTIFDSIMRVLAERLGIERGRLVLVDEAREELRIVAAYGLTPDELGRGTYDFGEGVTGKVVASGVPRVVRDTSQEPDFLYRTSVRRPGAPGGSFICQPIVLEGTVRGALNVDLPALDPETLDARHRLLTIVTAIIAQALQINRMVMNEKVVLVEELAELRENVLKRYQLASIIGDSRPMQEMFKTVAQVAATRATVLLIGETGTGKELVAKAIHFNSDRRNGPFIRVNCGALAGSLLESELFGHVRGAFTGAIRDKVGRFEAADGGTLFLDEVATLDMALQAKLLRAIQEREIERVGDSRPIAVDVRILAAANVDLQKEVHANRFREDLYYRLNVVTIRLPPLRERREDIPKLIDHFLDKYNADNQRTLRKMSRDVLAAMLRYPWPGNVRELENAIERAVVMSNGEEFTEALLPLAIRAFLQQGRHRTSSEPVDELIRRLVRQAIRDHELERSDRPIWDSLLVRVERALLEEGLARCDGVKIKAAEYLGINRNTLTKKFAELGLVSSTGAPRQGTGREPYGLLREPIRNPL